MAAEKFPVKIIDAVCQLHQQSKQGDTHMNMHIITSGGLSIVLFSGSVHFPGESIFMRRKRKPTPSGRFHSGGDNRIRFAFLPEGQKYRCCRRPAGGKQQFTGLARDLSRMVSPFASHQSLPCVRGGGPPNGGSEGLTIPQSAALIAPFTQGSLFSVVVR